MSRFLGAMLVLGVAAALIFLVRPETRQGSREVDVVSSIVGNFLIPMGNLTVISRPSDCRTDGLVKAALPATLIKKFLEANQTERGFDLSPFSPRLRIGDPSGSPQDIYVKSRRPVISVSRTGFAGSNALVCLEVFGLEERAFFVMLERRGAAWSVVRDFISWEEPDTLDLSSSEDGDDEPLFVPRASQIDESQIKHHSFDKSRAAGN